MSDVLTDEEKRYVTERIYTNISEDAVCHNTRGWTSRQIEYGIEHTRAYSGMTVAEKVLKAMLPEVRNREETAKSHALMEALRLELIATQRKIEDGAHIRDEAARAAEAEAIAAARHAENVRLTRRAIRWAVWATLVGILSVLFPLLSR